MLKIDGRPAVKNFGIPVLAALLQFGFVGTAHSADIDRVFWARAYTNLCLQETYANPRAMEALVLARRTASSVCGCGGDLMGATLTFEEAAYYAVNKQMRDDTRIRWRKGLVACVYTNAQ